MRPQRPLEDTFVTLVLCLASIALSACVGYGKPDGEGNRMSRAELSAHAEQVFRRHNQVETRVLSALHLSSGLPQVYETLLEAEAGMLDACEKLNELAIRRRDNKRIGLIEKWRIPKSIQACDEQTQAVEELLQKL